MSINWFMANKEEDVFEMYFGVCQSRKLMWVIVIVILAKSEHNDKSNVSILHRQQLILVKEQNQFTNGHGPIMVKSLYLNILSSLTFFLFLNGPTPASFLFIFGLFKQTIQFYNKSIWKKCPSSIWCQDSNTHPFKH